MAGWDWRMRTVAVGGSTLLLVSALLVLFFPAPMAIVWFMCCVSFVLGFYSLRRAQRRLQRIDARVFALASHSAVTAPAPETGFVQASAAGPVGTGRRRLLIVGGVGLALFLIPLLFFSAFSILMLVTLSVWVFAYLLGWNTLWEAWRRPQKIHDRLLALQDADSVYFGPAPVRFGKSADGFAFRLLVIFFGAYGLVFAQSRALFRHSSAYLSFAFILSIPLAAYTLWDTYRRIRRLDARILELEKRTVVAGPGPVTGPFALPATSLVVDRRRA